MQKNNRIGVLDSFRAIAIIAVLLYHYFYRWNNEDYPFYGADFFKYGFKGVSFFFIISGFVICYTLEKTPNFTSFWKKRFIRLFPSMLVASVLTFVLLHLFDFRNAFEDSNHIRNLIVSLTFLPPNLFDWIMGTKSHYTYLNFSYWSLWPEIQFYVLSSSIYFFDRTKFIRNFIIASFSVIFLYLTLLHFNVNQVLIIQKIIHLFNLCEHISFFLAGSLFYVIYKDSNDSKRYLIILGIVFILQNYTLDKVNLISISIMYSLFFCFIYRPQLLKFLENKILINIGGASYFLYLIHEYVGVVFIKNSVGFFTQYSFITPLLIAIFMILFSIYYTRKIESKVMKQLTNYLFKNKR